MEDILVKDIFDERVLQRLSPDYTPSQLILRMQMRRSSMKDTHCYRVKKCNDLLRKSRAKSISNKEMVELKSSFRRENLKNELNFKETSKTLKVKQNTLESELADLYNFVNTQNVQSDDVIEHNMESVNLDNKDDERNDKNSENNPNNETTTHNIDLTHDLQSFLINLALTSSPNDDDDNKFQDDHDDEKGDLNNISIPLPNTCPLQIDEEVDFLNIKQIVQPIDPNDLRLVEKYVTKWKEKVQRRKTEFEENRKSVVNNFLNRLKMKREKSNEKPNNSAAVTARDFATYKHRFKMQQHIIALQKLKLEEQNRMIEELKYNKIVEASKESVDKMKEEVKKTYYDIDRHLKPKIKCLTNELHIHEVEEPALVLHCLKVPQFLQRMEKRAREREEKHAMIRERRQQMEEEKIRMKQQAELAKQEMDKEEKARRIKELKDKRRREKIEAIRKKEYADKMRALTVMAELHYEKNLKSRLGLQPWLKLIEMKKINEEKAASHRKFLLKKNVFLNWMWYTEDQVYEREFIADDYYRKKVLRITFNALKENLRELVQKKQVAEDYYYLYVMQITFRCFRRAVEEEKKENEKKALKAIAYYNSNIKFKVLTCWRTLPAINLPP